MLGTWFDGRLLLTCPGSEIVDWLERNVELESRKEALSLAQVGVMIF